MSFPRNRSVVVDSTERRAADIRKRVAGIVRTDIRKSVGIPLLLVLLHPFCRAAIGWVVFLERLERE